VTLRKNGPSARGFQAPEIWVSVVGELNGGIYRSQPLLLVTNGAFIEVEGAHGI
jgi:hypothetical protein